MRRVQPIPPCPTALSPSGSPGSDERARAIAHFEGGRPPEAFKFAAYQNDEVRLALHSGFYWVCAYCERQVASIEVEHYRPKRRVQTEAGEKLGYYWLAATWDNLLPSCHDCNSRLRHWGPSGRSGTSGKGCWFPLEDESSRATQAGEETRECPLLLHPYHDEPAEHLEFVEEGVVRARKVDGVPSRRGEVTIDLLGLNRHGLPDARLSRLKVATIAWENLLRAEYQLRRRPDDARCIESYRRLVAELEEHLHPGAGFSAIIAENLGLT